MDAPTDPPPVPPSRPTSPGPGSRMLGFLAFEFFVIWSGIAAWSRTGNYRTLSIIAVVVIQLLLIGSAGESLRTRRRARSRGTSATD